MRMEQHVLNELHSFRFTGEDPKYALVISHGIGGRADEKRPQSMMSDEDRAAKHGAA